MASDYAETPLFVRMKRPSRLVQLEAENAALKTALSDALDLIQFLEGQREGQR